LRGLFLVAASLWLVSCAGARTEIILVVTSDLPVPAALDGVRFDMRSPSGEAQQSTADLGVTGLPVSLGMAYEGGPLGPFEVSVVGTLAGTDVLSRDLSVSFVEGETLVYRVVLLSSCVGVTCPAGLTCAENGCRPVEVDPSELGTYVSGGSGEVICSSEVCNGIDDDCDEVVDEEFDLSVDADHCGSCYAPCSPENAEGGCSAGICRLDACASGWSDCDGDPANGCESTTSDLTHCSACGVVCELTNATETCASATCEVVSCDAGWDNCDGRAENGCEINLASPANCGTCGTACDLEHATSSCATGTCELGSCEPGWDDCDGDPANGCETGLNTPANCGGCGTACAAPTPLCAAGSCTDVCPTDTVDCTGSCVDTTSDALHCGGCAMACPVAMRATAVCTDSSCGMACEPGWHDCDGDAANGCESDLSDLANCGGCGMACTLPNASEICTSGMCEIQTCEPGFADCDGSPTDGCEAPLDTLSDCGSCGTTCDLDHASEVCSGGSCSVVACEDGWADCNASAPDGCEISLSTSSDCGGCGTTCGATDLCAPSGSTYACASACMDTTCGMSCVDTGTDPVHCGGCGITCMAPAFATATCAGGSCDFNCNASFTECSGACVDTDTDMAHCGGCGADCDLSRGVASCMGGSCSLVSCDSGWGDCDSSDGNGCETNLQTSSVHCSMCGMACPGGQTCVAGACVGGQVVDVGTGENHTCAVMSSGVVKCWGDNFFGQLGDGLTATTSPTPVSVVGISDALTVSGGASHTCELNDRGRVECWGYGANGRLGNGSTANSATPVEVMGFTNARQLDVGREHACIIDSSNQIRCWGNNNQGQLGDGSTTNRPTAVAVSGISDAVAISAGGSSTCAVRSGGQVLCWGDNDDGQLGDGTTSRRSMPTPTGISDGVDVSVGRSFACAVRSGGTVMCWGRGEEGQIGNGTNPGKQLTPAMVSGLSDAVSISAGRRHACVLRAGDTVSCWGWNNEDQTAPSGGDRILTPMSVSGLTGIDQVAMGDRHSCARVGVAQLSCWGYNFYGQIGDGTTTGQPMPTTVIGVP